VSAGSPADIDVLVVGAGLAGIYAVHRLTQQGLNVVGIDAAQGFGGVWYHNRYPGARVDVDSVEYTYHFSADLWRQWQWKERYAAQPDLLEYLNFVAERLDVTRHFLFESKMTSARWNPDSARYAVSVNEVPRFSCRFLVMATGQLSAARVPDFPGLDRFRGRWVQTNRWPADDVDLEGKRVGVIGTGSSGVQTITAIAPVAGRLYVFQRTPNYVVPAMNASVDAATQIAHADVLAERRECLLNTLGGSNMAVPDHPAGHYSHEEQIAILERQWQFGGQGMNFVFLDQGSNKDSNDVVATFVRDKVRQMVRDPVLAEKLVPNAYPIGTRRLCLDVGYYDVYNRDNVTLVDIRSDPIIEITESGIGTESTHYELDVIVFALGFHAFKGALERADIRNALGELVTDRWQRGPRTLLGVMTSGFPNLFLPSGPGSPSVLANMFLMNEFYIDWIADCIAFLDAHGHSTIEPLEDAQEEWGLQVAEAASRLLRLTQDNYMVHVNDDATRVFIPYVGGAVRYVEAARRCAAEGYRGFALV
jgi:cation diffusion facilitator CzcD-associated flavoprotein CzcO